MTDDLGAADPGDTVDTADGTYDSAFDSLPCNNGNGKGNGNGNCKDKGNNGNGNGNGKGNGKKKWRLQRVRARKVIQLSGKKQGQTEIIQGERGTGGPTSWLAVLAVCLSMQRCSCYCAPAAVPRRRIASQPRRVPAGACSCIPAERARLAVPTPASPPHCILGA